MERTPKEIIRQARYEAEKELMNYCSKEIQRICNNFEKETGAAITEITFNMVDITSLCDENTKTVVSSATVQNESI